MGHDESLVFRAARPQAFIQGHQQNLYGQSSEDDEYHEQTLYTHKEAQTLKKPDIPYVNLIIEALESAAPQRTMLTLPEIYKRIMARHPYYKTAPPRWRNSIRHNLSLHPIFARVASDEKTKGSYWKFATGAPDEAPKPQSSLKLKLERKFKTGYKASSNGKRFFSIPGNKTRIKTEQNSTYHTLHRHETSMDGDKVRKEMGKCGEKIDDDDEFWTLSTKCWSPIEQISRLSASEPDTDDESGERMSRRTRRRLLLSLDYGRDLKPLGILQKYDDGSQKCVWVANSFSQSEEYYYNMLSAYHQWMHPLPSLSSPLPPASRGYQGFQHVHYTNSNSTTRGLPITTIPVRRLNSNAGCRLADASC